jgi:hypothetical protein
VLPWVVGRQGILTSRGHGGAELQCWLAKSRQTRRYRSPLATMFPSLRLFHNLACPNKNSCTRPTCLFSHRPDLLPPPSLVVPFEESKPSASTSTTVPAKRPIANSPLSTGSPIGEPPRKLQKLGSTQKQVAAPSTSYTAVSAMYFKPPFRWPISVLLRVAPQSLESMLLNQKSRFLSAK